MRLSSKYSTGHCIKINVVYTENRHLGDGTTPHISQNLNISIGFRDVDFQMDTSLNVFNNKQFRSYPGPGGSPSPQPPWEKSLRGEVEIQMQGYARNRPRLVPVLGRDCVTMRLQHIAF